MINNTKSKVIVAMSGGVDSSVSAWMLKAQGYEVEGMFMDLGIGQEEEKKRVKQVADFLDIKLRIVDISKSFKQEVIDYFLDSYKQGFTPNPCIKCNKKIKFGVLLQEALKYGDYLATGHYIKKRYSQYLLIHVFLEVFKKIFKPEYKIYKSQENTKDQTYFLYNLQAQDLEKIKFPLSFLKKNKVKQIAREQNIPNFSQESQDICFLQGDHNLFLKKHLHTKPGEIRDLDENVLGEHQGLYFYTIGQRRGINLGGNGPYYAAKFDGKNNILYVVNTSDHPVLYSTEFHMKEINWISQTSPEFPLQCEVVIRYGHRPINCRIEKQEEGYKVYFDIKQRAVTPGQSAAFYQGRQLLGGGIIYK